MKKLSVLLVLFIVISAIGFAEATAITQTGEVDEAMQKALYPIALKKVKEIHGDDVMIDVYDIRINSIYNNLDGSVIVGATLSPYGSPNNTICNSEIVIQFGAFGTHVLSYKTVD